MAEERQHLVVRRVDEWEKMKIDGETENGMEGWTVVGVAKIWWPERKMQ